MLGESRQPEQNTRGLENPTCCGEQQQHTHDADEKVSWPNDACPPPDNRVADDDLLLTMSRIRNQAENFRKGSATYINRHHQRTCDIDSNDGSCIGDIAHQNNLGVDISREEGQGVLR